MRILIYSVSAGAGHVRSAEALQAAFKRFYPEVETAHVDVMKLVPAAFKNAYTDGYLKLINTMPSVWGWLYTKTDQVSQNSALAKISKFVQRLNTSRILEHAAQHKPDVIVATHFLPAEIFSDQARKSPSRGNNGSTPSLAVVITDHDVHQLWVHDRVDRYYTASEEIKHLLAERDIPLDLIKASGIPCDPVFGEPLDEPARQRLRKMLGLAGAPSPTLLLNVHGCGVRGAGAAASLGAVANAVLQKGPPKTILVVCGRNSEIKKALAATLVVPPGCVIKLFDFVSNMHELMGIADLIVTKPGGLTTSECLARCLPLMLVSPIPGQEERNAEMLLEQGCAALARTPAALAYKLEALLNSPDRLQQMRECCRRTGKPHAAAEIAADVLELARTKGKRV
jgi:processive 1,2-diacylglycerol beta-glucosyltransferase